MRRWIPALFDLLLVAAASAGLLFILVYLPTGLMAAAEPVLREAERGATVEDPVEAGRMFDSIGARGTSLNLVFRALDPGMYRGRADDLRAWFRMLQLAAELEQAFDGRYPAADAAMERPIDPHGWPEPLRYEPSPNGTGYRVWSVGFDRVDDGGTAEGHRDLVLERRPRSAPASD